MNFQITYKGMLLLSFFEKLKICLNRAILLVQVKQYLQKNMISLHWNNIVY